MEGNPYGDPDSAGGAGAADQPADGAGAADGGTAAGENGERLRGVDATRGVSRARITQLSQFAEPGAYDFRSDAQREGSSEQAINTSDFDGAAPALREHARLTPGCRELLLARTAHSGKNRFGHLVLGTP